MASQFLTPYTGREIQKKRLALKMKQKELGTLAAVHENTVSNIETGRYDNPSTRMLLTIILDELDPLKGESPLRGQPPVIHIESKKESQTVRVEPSGRGYYTMTIDGVFAGNYDSAKEAWDDYEASRTQ